MVYEAKIIDILSDSCPNHLILTGQVLRILDQDSFILGDDSGSVHVDHMDFYHESKGYIVAKKYVKLVNPKVVKGPGPALYLDEETKLFPFKPFSGCRGEPIFQLSNVAQLNPCQKIYKIIAKVVNIHKPCKSRVEGEMLRVDIKDESKQKLCLRMRDKRLAEQLKTNVVYEIYHVLVSNFPNVERKPYFLESTDETTIVVATQEEQRKFSYIEARDDNICGMIVGIENPKFYDSCPSCFTKVRNPAHHVWNINGRVGYLCHVCSVIFVPPYKDFKFDVLVKEDDGNVRTVIGFKRYIQDLEGLDSVPRKQMEEFLNFELVGKDGKDQDLRPVSAEDEGFLLAYPIAPDNANDNSEAKERARQDSGTTSVACSEITEQSQTGSVLQSPLDRPKTPKDAANEEDANGEEKEISEASTLVRSNSFVKTSSDRPTTCKEVRKHQEVTNGTEEEAKEF